VVVVVVALVVVVVVVVKISCVQFVIHAQNKFCPCSARRHFSRRVNRKMAAVKGSKKCSVLPSVVQPQPCPKSYVCCIFSEIIIKCVCYRLYIQYVRKVAVHLGYGTYIWLSVSKLPLKCAVVSLYSVVKQRLKCNTGKECNCLIQVLLTLFHEKRIQRLL
jgi:hypothetical protein